MAEQARRPATCSTGCGANSTDANQTWGAFARVLCASRGRRGQHHRRSDPVREVLITPSASSPTCRETIAYDDASNNEPCPARPPDLEPAQCPLRPRDAPAIAATWHFPNPSRRWVDLPHRPYFWGIWQWAQNKSAARDLLPVSQRDVVTNSAFRRRAMTSHHFCRWRIAGVADRAKGHALHTCAPSPRCRALHRGPVAAGHRGADPEPLHDPGMVARMVTGQTAKQTIDWAKRELEGIRR
jgi:hypothetical protein